MEPPKPLEGVLHFHSETGTEGGYWAFQDKRFITPPTEDLPHESWSYEGLHTLGDGDFLTIYDKKNPERILWHGWIRLKQHDLFTEHTADGFWIHADQIGVDRAVWANYFFEGHPAKLIPAP